MIKLKEKINYLKFWIGVCVASLISLGAWLSLNFGRFSKLYLCGVLCGVMLFIILLVCIISLDKKIRNLINKLEEL